MHAELGLQGLTGCSRHPSWGRERRAESGLGRGQHQQGNPSGGPHITPLGADSKERLKAAPLSPSPEEAGHMPRPPQ